MLSRGTSGLWSVSISKWQPKTKSANFSHAQVTASASFSIAHTFSLCQSRSEKHTPLASRRLRTSAEGQLPVHTRKHLQPLWWKIIECQNCRLGQLCLDVCKSTILVTVPNPHSLCAEELSEWLAEFCQPRRKFSKLVGHSHESTKF